MVSVGSAVNKIYYINSLIILSFSLCYKLVTNVDEYFHRCLLQLLWVCYIGAGLTNY